MLRPIIRELEDGGVTGWVCGNHEPLCLSGARHQRHLRECDHVVVLNSAVFMRDVRCISLVAFAQEEGKSIVAVYDHPAVFIDEVVSALYDI